MKLTFATVSTGNYEGRGKEYTAKLFAGLRANMPSRVDLRCVCLTDDPGILPNGVEAISVPFGPASWWQKLWLFSSGTFTPGERCLYGDLDMIITGDLGDIAAYAGKFAALRDPYHFTRMSSSLMAWEAGHLDHVWTKWDEAGRPQFDPQGDQNWIEAMQPEYDRWQDLLPGQCNSFKSDCWLNGKLPHDTRVLYFHGRPRPHECKIKFVKDLWNRPTP